MIKSLSFLDTLLFNACYSFPAYLQGLFTKRAAWVSVWTALRIDRFGIRLISRFRRKYAAEFFRAKIRNSETVIVLEHDAIRHVLANSPAIFADGESKRAGMSHFQPGAVTISRGAEWQDRRKFNEAVLDTGQPVHQHADRFLSIVQTATDALHDAAGSRLRWHHIDELFEHIASRVILGVPPRAGQPVFDRLVRLMRESNRVFGLKESKHFEPFYKDLRTSMDSAEEGSLAAMCHHVPSTAATRVENQVPHWMFALRETLAANTARALALIVSHPDKERRVRDELIWADRWTPEVIGNMRYLEGCVQEAMRLWPTTPFLARELAAPEPLGGVMLEPGTQILILNTFNHRDRENIAEADAFCPELWYDGPPAYPFNHLSSGAQACAGKDLALFLSKAVLAHLLRKGRYELKKPSIDPRKPIPSMYNYFRLSFDVRA